MEELIEKLEQLKDIIYQEDVVLEFLIQKKKTFEDRELVLKIESYHKLPSDALKKEIEQSPSFLAYKEKESELQLLIFGINQKFRKLRSSVDCQKRGML